jgi:RNA polymerase sigma-70 factor, ECF subfamily
MMMADPTTVTTTHGMASGAFPAHAHAPMDVEGPADEALVKRLRNGEPSAGETLARRYYQPLMRYLQRLAGTDHLAEELYQATWLSVLEHVEKFNPSSTNGGFRAWLFRIATNKANDIWRARGREKIVKQGLRLVIEAEAPQAGQHMEASEQQHKLLHAIGQLPENQRQVLMLRYYSGMKFVEIADVLGCPLNTALGRMHKAMMKLKQLMEE